MEFIVTKLASHSQALTGSVEKTKRSFKQSFISVRQKVVGIQICS